MSEIKKAAFGLIDFRVNQFNFKYDDSFDSKKVSIEFNPRGEFNTKDGVYNLYINFRAFNKKNDIEFFNSEIMGVFLFTNVDAVSSIPSFFYKNAIAILYPYLRAFVSTVTLQSNISNILLPTMNLGSLESTLKESTKEF